MSVKRKISVRKILQVILTATVTTCCVTAMVSAARIEGNERLASVAVHIRNDKKYHFIEQNEITDLVISNRNIDIEHTPLSKLDIHGMEQVLLADPWVASAEVFVDNERILHIYVTQRVPVARLFPQNSASYYLDSTMSIMPLSKNYVYYTTVVTNVPDLKNDSAGRAMKKQIVTLARALQADSFWNTQVAEVVVDSDATFDLVPVLGNQVIVFGDLSGMKEKFSNLFLFYKNVLNRIGWDKYDKLDVRFSGQVIASPSLPYKGPVDKAVVNMNWINTMVEAGDKADAKDSVRPPAGIKPAHNIATPGKVYAKQVGKPVKPPQRPMAAPGAKKAALKPPALHAKKSSHTKTMVKAKSAKIKNSKKASPKYIYPAKKDH
jgi:cell division protein FtsQ